MVTNAELIFWIVCAVLAILFFIVMVCIGKHLENKERERMFDHCKFTEYHDDMEDR